MNSFLIFVLIVAAVYYFWKKKHGPRIEVKKEDQAAPANKPRYDFYGGQATSTDPRDAALFSLGDAPPAEKKDYYSTDFDFSVFKRKRIFSNNEQEFFLKLEAVNDGRYHIFSKVRILDIVDIYDDLKYSNNSKYFEAFNRISKMHFDFVLVSRDKHYVVCIIELDDKSHENRKSRDEFIDTLLNYVNLPLIRIQALQNGAYTTDYIKDNLVGFYQNH